MAIRGTVRVVRRLSTNQFVVEGDAAAIEVLRQVDALMSASVEVRANWKRKPGGRRAVMRMAGDDSVELVKLADEPEGCA